MSVYRNLTAGELTAQHVGLRVSIIYADQDHEEGVLDFLSVDLFRAPEEKVLLSLGPGDGDAFSSSGFLVPVDHPIKVFTE